MTFSKRIRHLIARFRYPVSLPDDISKALGVPLSNEDTFDHVMSRICSRPPTRIKRFMPRKEVETAFSKAVCIERFSNSSVCSFSFTQGRIIFVLKFDENNRLRRMYLQHKQILSDQGLEIPLHWEVRHHPDISPLKTSVNTHPAYQVSHGTRS